MSSTEGWVRSRGLLLFTADGGESWQPASKPAGLNDFGPGAVVGQTRFQMNVPTSGSGIYRTDDGGRTWKALEGKLPWNSAQAVFFVGLTSGWIAGDQGLMKKLWYGGGVSQARPQGTGGSSRGPRQPDVDGTVESATCALRVVR